jgi:hypothetical protein
LHLVHSKKFGALVCFPHKVTTYRTFQKLACGLGVRRIAMLILKSQYPSTLTDTHSQTSRALVCFPSKVTTYCSEMCHRRALQAPLPRAPPTHPNPRPAGRARVVPVCMCMCVFVFVCVCVCVCIIYILTHNIYIYIYIVYIHMYIFTQRTQAAPHGTLSRTRTNDTPLYYLSNVFPIECVFYRFQHVSSIDSNTPLHWRRARSSSGRLRVLCRMRSL